MPHFIIEHAKAFIGTEDIESALNITLECGAASGFINREDIKVRAIPYEDFLFGDGKTNFIHVTVRLLAGRTDSQKESLSISLRDSLAGRFPDVQSISIDVQDMNPASYKKRLL